MDPYQDAVLLLSFQEERRRNRVEELAQAAAAPRPDRWRARLMRASGAMLIVIGSRLLRWSGSPRAETLADSTSEVAWQ